MSVTVSSRNQSSKEVFDPVSTYRIQFNKEFTLTDFEEIIPYIHQLGVRTIYASPVFEAAPGSTHGYDGTNPNRINPEIGTEDQLVKIAGELKKRDIFWLQDIVPNHLAFHENNKWLMDMLDKGKSSAYANVFDVNWNHPDYPGRVMVPFPGSSLEMILRDRYPGEENYVLCSWQETDFRMNYRRFFLVNTLICTNIHIDEVFQRYHQLVRKMMEEEVFRGLRIDHIDGLYDPTKYLHDLRSLAGDNAYIIVEKILEPGEEMPFHWPVQGNSGYDFLAIVNNLFTNRAAEFDLTALYYDINGDGTPIDQQIHNKKHLILTKHMQGELNNLVQLYRDVTGSNPVLITDEELKISIAQYLVQSPVYRYYDDYPLMEIDKNKNPELLKPFYQRCMQFTGPLMAKGVEDTLMYTYNRFIGHNEVGDSPVFFGYTIERFHELMQERNRKWPYSLNASSTHDTKRGEDTRARLNVITDLYIEWIRLVKQWQDENTSLKKDGMPDSNDEYFIYQTLVGSFPPTTGRLKEDEMLAYKKRLKEYLEKSIREAKVHSTWTDVNRDYENAAITFTYRLLDNNGDFYRTFMPFLNKVTTYGIINSLSQLVLKFTCPGIPDVYQGTELWDLSLVDPDNRRPVDFRMREQILSEPVSAAGLWKVRADGRIKLKLLHELLKIRTHYNDVFSKGDYIPLKIEGALSDNALAFLRTNNHHSIITVIPLHMASIHTYNENEVEIPRVDWKDTKMVLPPGSSSNWKNLLHGGRIISDASAHLNDIFREFPVAVLLNRHDI